jgi:hypothetical protein
MAAPLQTVTFFFPPTPEAAAARRPWADPAGTTSVESIDDQRAIVARAPRDGLFRPPAVVEIWAGPRGDVGRPRLGARRRW